MRHLLKPSNFDTRKKQAFLYCQKFFFYLESQFWSILQDEDILAYKYFNFSCFHVVIPCHLFVGGQQYSSQYDTPQYPSDQHYQPPREYQSQQHYQPSQEYQTDPNRHYMNTGQIQLTDEKPSSSSFV